MSHSKGEGAIFGLAAALLFGISAPIAKLLLPERGPVMNLRLAFASLLLLFLGAPVYAQSPCTECLKAAEEKLKTCLVNAISVDDKSSCEDSRKQQLKACEDDVCRIEREIRDTKSDAPSQKE